MYCSFYALLIRLALLYCWNLLNAFNDCVYASLCVMGRRDMLTFWMHYGSFYLADSKGVELINRILIIFDHFKTILEGSRKFFACRNESMASMMITLNCNRLSENLTYI